MCCSSEGLEDIGDDVLLLLWLLVLEGVDFGEFGISRVDWFKLAIGGCRRAGVFC